MATFILIVAVALAVLLEATGDPMGWWFGIKPDWLSPLMVYAGLTVGPRAIVFLAVTGGLLHDSLSVMPLGVSIVPLAVIGLLVNHLHPYLFREQFLQQIMLGAVAALLSVSVTLIVLAIAGTSTPVSFGLLLKAVSLMAVGAVITPIMFLVIDFINEWVGAVPPKYERPSPAWSARNIRRDGPPKESVRQRAYK